MAAHTVGPFRAEVPPSSSGFGRAIYAQREDGPDVFVAYVGNWKQKPATENADAALFVASPAMLAALKKAIEDWPQFEEGNDEPVNGGDMVEWFGNWIQIARAAVQQAEG